MSATNNPFITVVILTGIQRKRAEKTLASILNQEGLETAEVLIFDTVLGKYPPLKGSEHPAVKIIASTSATSYSGLRAQGAEIARGQVISYLEDHAEALPGWFKAITRGIENGHAGVGGVPQASNAGVGFSDISGMINYKYALDASSPQAYVAPTLPNHNSAYRRDVLLSFGDQLRTMLTSDSILGIKITEKGYSLLIDPELRFLHANLVNSLMVGRNFFYWNIIFGRARAQIFKWSWLRRALQIFITPISPFIRYFKYFLHVQKYNREKLPLFFRNAVTALYTQTVAAVGIAIGCLFDVKNAEIKFLKYELDLEHYGLKSS